MHPLNDRHELMLAYLHLQHRCKGWYCEENQEEVVIKNDKSCYISALDAESELTAEISDRAKMSFGWLSLMFIHWCKEPQDCFDHWIWCSVKVNLILTQII